MNRKIIEGQIKEWKSRTDLGHLRKVQYRIIHGKLKIYCSRPGSLIGKDGKLVKEYSAKMKIHGINEIEIVSVEDTLI